MNRRMKRVKFLLLSIISILCLSVPAFAADSTVTYVGNAQKFIFAPGSDDSPTDLFENFKGVMPGDSLTQKITVKNDVSNNTKIKLYLRSLGAQEGSEDFLSKLTLSVKQDGDSHLFEAPADQTAQLTDWVYLGTIYSGGEINLDVTLEIPQELNNRFQNAIGYLDWQFKVEEPPVEPDDPKPPQTGDTSNLFLYSLLTVVSGISFLILLIIKRRKIMGI